MRPVHLLRTDSGRSCPRLSITEIRLPEDSGVDRSPPHSVCLYLGSDFIIVPLFGPSKTIYSSVVIQLQTLIASRPQIQTRAANPQPCPQGRQLVNVLTFS